MKRRRPRVKSKPKRAIQRAQVAPAPPRPRREVALNLTAERQAGLRWQILPAMLACAAGIALLALALPSLARFQVGGGTKTWAVLGVGAAFGTIAGVWLPRWFLRRRENTLDADEPTTPPISFDFAAGVVAGLLLLLALVAVLVVLSLRGFEDYRTWLVMRWGWPAGLHWLFIVTPLLMLAALLALVWASTMTALHGWYRLVAGPAAGFGKLWLALLAGAIVGWILHSAVPSLAAQVITSLALLSAAVGLAVARRRAVMLVTQRTNALEQLSLLVSRIALAIGGVALLVLLWPVEQQDEPPQLPEIVTHWLAPQAEVWQTTRGNLWLHDLYGERYDTLVLVDDVYPELWPDRQAVARLAQRAFEAVLPGGRIVVVMPSEAATRVAEAWSRQANERLRARLWRIDHELHHQTVTCFVYDPGFAAWRERAPLPEGWEVQVTRPGG